MCRHHYIEPEYYFRQECHCLHHRHQWSMLDCRHHLFGELDRLYHLRCEHLQCYLDWRQQLS